jgi:peroxiredoxin Q/BCP
LHSIKGEITVIEEGKKAPDFKLPDDKGNEVSLSSFKGKKVVLYFYPKDNTPGCTKEACGFRDSFPEFENVNAVILGVSGDSVASHQKFKNKHELPFTLLSDENKEIIEKYGVLKEKSMFGKTFMGIERTTVVIDENGNVQKIFPKVKVNGHVEEVLQEVNNN